MFNTLHITFFYSGDRRKRGGMSNSWSCLRNVQIVMSRAIPGKWSQSGHLQRELELDMREYHKQLLASMQNRVSF